MPYDSLGLGGSRRVRHDGTLVPRNSFKNDVWSKLDLRVSKRFVVAGDVQLTGIAEVFNILNQSRFTRNTIEGRSNFGDPRRAAIDPLMGQLAIRLAF